LKRLLVALVAVAVFVPAAHAAIPSLSYRCTPGGVNDCSAWYRVPVEVTWIYNTGDAEPIGGDCTNWTKKTFGTDTKGTQLTCQVRDPANHADTASTGTSIHIDRTGPTVTGPGLGRAPDTGDWFNHPVGFGFTGQDATSGIASCTGGTYGGPDGAGVSVTGSCRDVAGNVTSGAFTINYDATPPPEPDVSVLPGNHRVTLTWDSSGYVAEVVRLSAASAQAVVFRGATGRFTDSKLKNGRRYRYAVTLIDQAGNTAADVTSAVPTSSKLLLPANGAHLTSPPELVWKPVKRANYYNAQLLHRGRKVLTRWPVTNSLQLQERWRSLGRRHRLAQGRYCWYVWPGFGPRHERDYGRLLGSSCFRITG
jgi:hypothetical protein